MSVVKDNFKIKETPDKKKAVFIRGWMGDTVVYKLRRFDWPDNEWNIYDKVIQYKDLNS